MLPFCFISIFLLCSVIDTLLPLLLPNADCLEPKSILGDYSTTGRDAYACLGSLCLAESGPTELYSDLLVGESLSARDCIALLLSFGSVSDMSIGSLEDDGGG